MTCAPSNEPTNTSVETVSLECTGISQIVTSRVHEPPIMKRRWLGERLRWVLRLRLVITALRKGARREWRALFLHKGRPRKDTAQSWKVRRPPSLDTAGV
jgi:hypothetical protein